MGSERVEEGVALYVVQGWVPNERFRLERWTCRSASSGFGLPIPYDILDGFSDGAVELLLDSSIVAKEACLEFSFDRGIDLFAEDSEEVIGIAIDHFVDDHPLCLSTGRHTNHGDFGLTKLTDIPVVPVLLVDLATLDVGSASNWVAALASATFSLSWISDN